ncbi:MAG: hypothetical protein VB855_02450 [Pirellulaceae bacterium]
MIKRSANQSIFLLLLSFLTLGNVVTGVLLGQDSPASPRPLAAAVLSRSYMVEHLDLETAAVQVRQALDPAEARVFLDRIKNQVVVKGTVGAHQLAAEMLRTIDRPRVSSSTIPIPVIQTTRQLRCYLVTPNNVERWTEELNRRYEKISGVRITPDVKNGQITVVAPVAIHKQLGQLLSASLPLASKDDWQPRDGQQAIAIEEKPLATDLVVPVTRIEEPKFEQNDTSDRSEWLARVIKQRPGAFPGSVPVSEEKPVSSELPAGDVPVVEAPLLQPAPAATELEKTAPRELATGKKKVASAFPQSRIAAYAPASRQQNDKPDPAPEKQETVKDENTIADSLRKDFIGGVKSIDDEFRSLHDMLTKPVTGFFESVQEDISISVTEMAETVSKKFTGQEREQDSRPRAARVIRVGGHSATTEPATPAVKSKPVEKPVFEVVPLKAEPKKPLSQPPRTVVPVPSRKVIPTKSPPAVPPAPRLPVKGTSLSPEVKKPVAPVKSVETKPNTRPEKPAVITKPIPQVSVAPAPTPTVTRQPVVTPEKTTAVKPASQLVETGPVTPRVKTPATPARIPQPKRVATSTVPAADAAGISLVGASDKEIVEFVARHLRMREAGELVGCEIRMMLQDRHVWFVLERDNGTMVRIRVGEIKLDREGKGVLVVDPEKLQR